MVLIVRGKDKQRLDKIIEEVKKRKSKYIIINPVEILKGFKINITTDFQDEEELYYKSLIMIINSVLEEGNINLFIPIEENKFNKLSNLFQEIRKIIWEVYEITIDTEEEISKSVKEIYSKINVEKETFVYNELLENKVYNLFISEVDLKSVNSAHQTINHINKRDNGLEIEVELHPMIIRQELDMDGVEKYLQESEKLNEISEKLKEEDDRENYWIYNAINFLKDNYGQLKLEEAIVKYANIMRGLNLPCKYILGTNIDYKKTFWVEVYISNVGWIPVDITWEISKDIDNWYFGITNRHIKLFEGEVMDDLIKIKDKISFEIN